MSAFVLETYTTSIKKLQTHMISHLFSVFVNLQSVMTTEQVQVKVQGMLFMDNTY